MKNILSLLGKNIYLHFLPGRGEGMLGKAVGKDEEMETSEGHQGSPTTVLKRPPTSIPSTDAHARLKELCRLFLSK